MKFLNHDLCAAVVLAFGLLGVCHSTSAAVIFSNGTPQFSPVPAQGALFAEAGSSFSEAADNFSLGAGQNVIRDVHWWGVYGTNVVNPPADNFAIRIYDNSAAAPGTLNTTANILSLTRTLQVSTITGLRLYLYDAVISPIALAPSTTYWLGLSNTSGNNWAWVQSANSGGNAYQYSPSTGTFGLRNKELAFNLTNDIVPEPSTTVLLIIGALTLAGGRLVRQRK